MTRELRIHGYSAPLDTEMPLASYGSDAVQIEDLMRQEPDLARPLHPALAHHGAQVVWAARHEMARTLDDVLARRTRALYLNPGAALAMAPVVVRLLARELGRDEPWQIRQLEDFGRVAACFDVSKQPQN